MNTEQKKILIEKIQKLRTKEYISGLASGLQDHEQAAKKDLEAYNLFCDIEELINL